MQQNYPFLVLVPSMVADKTTMGEYDFREPNKGKTSGS